MMADTPTEPHYIVCYFGAKYAPMLGVLLQSVADVQPCRKVVLLHYDTPADVLRMACNYPNVIARPVERQGYPAAMAAALKPLILADYLASPTLNGPTLVVDCDMLVRRDSFDLFREDDGILFTTRDGVWPINGGIIGIRNPLDPGVARFFHRWANRIVAIARDPALMAVARSESHPYGHVDQMAFSETIGYERSTTEFIPQDCGGLKARAIDGYILNETRSVPIAPETRILHYKGGWHPILLDGHTFTRNRPMRAGWEMFTLYGDIHNRTRRFLSATVPESIHGRMPLWYDPARRVVMPYRYGLRCIRDGMSGCIATCRVSAGRLRAILCRRRSFSSSKAVSPGPVPRSRVST